MPISQALLPNGKSPGVNRIIRLWRQLTEPSPSLKSVADRRRAQLLSIITLILSLLFIVALFYGPSSYGAFLTLTGITLISYALSRTRHYRAGNYLFTYAFTALAYMRIFMGSAESIEAAVVSTVHITLVFSSVLLSRRGFVGLVALATLATFTAPLYSTIPGESGNIGRTGGVVLVIGAILYGITVFRENLEKEQRRELSDANRELEDIKDGLEKRIEDRTLELQTASLQAQDRADRLQNITDISHEIASITTLKTEDLLTRMTQIISEKLGYYHVGIFLLDEKREYAVLQAANSEGGRHMLGRHHQLKVGGAGIVGYVAQSGRPRIALNTGADAVFFNNPDLPETRSEISLPLKFEDTVLGVLDVQSTQPSAFNEEDIKLLGALANLLALVIRNRRLAEGSGSGPDTAAARRPAQLRRKGRQSGYAFRPDGIVAADVPPDEDPLMQKAIVSGEVAVQNQTDTGAPPALAVPVKLRERVIGILHIEAADINRRWTDDEINVAQAISERAAFALENALLLEDATRRAEQEQTIAQITTRIGASTGFERIMKTAVQELGQALGASRSFIQIGSANSEKDQD
jgi:GAF domain-containing protein